MTIEPFPMEGTKEPAPTEVVELVDEESQLLAEAYEISLDTFRGLKVADRDTIIFALLREVAATNRDLSMRLDVYEEKAKELASPEGIQTIMDKFMGGSGGLLGGLFR